MKSRYILAAALAGTITLAGCADMSQQDQRVLSGAAIGTAAGAAVGAITGDWAWAAGGAAAGAIGGYLVDQQKQREQAAYERGVKQGQAQQKKQ